VRLITSPYHDGLENIDRGRGPSRLVEAAGATTLDTVAPVDPAAPEAARVFELARRLAELVRATIADGAFPLVLAGDCNSCLGTVAGCGPDSLGVVWFDAHTDFDTPESSSSGSLDAMGLALLTGSGWRALRSTVSGLSAVDEANVVLVGVRDFEPGQRDRLQQSRIRWFEGGNFASGDLRRALEELRNRMRRLYLHIDLDALDLAEGTANQYSAAGGLSTEQLLAAIADVFERFDVIAAAITAYNPDADVDGRMAATAARVLGAVARCARKG
jgi:arginase